MARTRQRRLAIIGAGAGGLCMAALAKRDGRTDVVILERSSRLGGTWNENRYPGAGCDIPSHLYAFSFDPNPSWSRKFSLQPEILAYLEAFATRQGVLEDVRFGAEVTDARFDAEAGVWVLQTSRGEEVADALVHATGQLNRPVVPDFPGLASFEGRAFHSARWPEALELDGLHVAVVGSGASAIQIVPEVAKRARSLTLFQRSPSWVIPRKDRPYRAFEKALFERVPSLRRAYRSTIWARNELLYLALRKDSPGGAVVRKLATDYLNQSISDPTLREKLVPRDALGCKRLLISDDYYAALARPNAEVCTDAIARIAPHGIVTKDERLHEASVIVFATGFSATSFLAPMRVRGLNQSLDEAWRDGAEAYYGIDVAGFPNMFVLYGPNTNLGHNSILFMLECQAQYILQRLRQTEDRSARWSMVKEGVQAAHNRELQPRLASSAWASGCSSWYQTASGKITTNWPGSTLEYWWRTRRPNPADFEYS